MHLETKRAVAEPQALGSGDKVYWEVQKLQAEIDNLRKPPYRSPTVMVPLISAVVAAIVAVVGAGFKYQMNQLEARRVELQVADLQQQRVSLLREVEAVQSDADKVTAQLKTANEQLADAQKALAVSVASADSAEAKQAVTQAQSSLVNLEKATRETQQAQAARSQRLSTIRSRIAESTDLSKVRR